MSSVEPLVLAERHGRVLLLTLNRPDRMNAWTDELEKCYFELLDEAEADGDIRAVVVTGAGRAFCAGFDLDVLADPEKAARIGAECGRSRLRPYLMRKPLIAAINGAAAGLGLVEALYCDVRFCAPTAKLTTAFAQRGLIAEYGMAWLMARLVGPGLARDLLLSARVILGEEAKEIGLVEHVVPGDAVLEEAVRYASELAASSSPTSMAVMKTQIRRSLYVDMGTAYAEAETLMREALGREDFSEGVRSFLERRPPSFTPLPDEIG